ncbi:hypothetical protein J2T55_001039 [Methylohalomonas lacus]|uniref:DUF4124 domain-containing protein n=1 Tax=Methylohalomonas lacus TaxID=398773 RepID=A0AAE3HL80_9GAMM|nr:DUF4124 domain-containing protein [Methylohalomonas lacus]MCS3903022.1 hypothetical protein [Methylohalomonas lacus]
MQRATLFTLLLLLPIGAGAEVYKWVDEQGQVHYGDKPATGSAQSLDIDRTPAAPDPEREQRREKRDRLLQQFADERTTARRKAEEQARQKKERERRCEQARQQLWRYEHSQYLYEDTASGERRILDDDERARQEQQLRDYLDAECP